MEISERSWQRFIDALRKVNDTAAAKIREFLRKYGLPTTREAVNALIDYAYSVSTVYGEAAAELAAEMYDTVATISKVIVESAIPASTPEIGEVAKTIVGTLKTGNEEIVSSAIGRLVKQTGVDTTMQNAIRDHAEWAWIPHGDTCAFCITLASNGWQRASKKALKGGHAEHIHANCDCTYAIRFNRDTNVAGYDPDVYREMYYGAEGNTPTERINYMRREIYAEDSEEINEQKRSAYAKRVERESSEAEELDI